MFLEIKGSFNLISIFFAVTIYMSLSVLKRKSETKYNKLSSRGSQGFSLNNPRRVSSHSGQTQTQTLMKGTALRGHGTCCGKFPIVMNKSQYVNYDAHVRDFSSSKANQGISVKNHTGSMAIRHKWLKSGYPNYVVKNTRQTDYDMYVAKLHSQSAIQNYASTEEALTKDNCASITYSESSDGTQNCKKKVSTIVKNVGTMSQSEYLKTKYLQRHCLPTPVSKLHYPTPQSGQCNSCGTAGSEGIVESSTFGVICE